MNHYDQRRKQQLISLLENKELELLFEIAWVIDSKFNVTMDSTINKLGDCIKHYGYCHRINKGTSDVAKNFNSIKEAVINFIVTYDGE